MATLATIRALARIRADQTNSQFPTDAEYLTLINAAGSRTWRKLIRAGWRPGFNGTAIVANGASSYTLGTTMHLVVEVYRIDGNIRTPIPALKPEDRARMLSSGNGPATAYELFRGVRSAPTISFYPTPTSGTYEVVFIETFNPFALDADVWYGPDGSDELVAIEAALMALDKEGVTDTRRLEKEYDQIYADVCEHAGWRESQAPATVRDARSIHKMTDPFNWNASEGWV